MGGVLRLALCALLAACSSGGDDTADQLAIGTTRSTPEAFPLPAETPAWIAERGGDIDEVDVVDPTPREGERHAVYIDLDARVLYTERCADGAPLVGGGGPYGPVVDAGVTAFRLECLG
jgi:hypothetical protein